MSQTEIENRIGALEKDVSTLKDKFQRIENAEPWWKGRIGIFSGDAQHEEAMRLGSMFRKNEGSNGDAES